MLVAHLLPARDVVALARPDAPEILAEALVLGFGNADLFGHGAFQRLEGDGFGPGRFELGLQPLDLMRERVRVGDALLRHGVEAGAEVVTLGGHRL